MQPTALDGTNRDRIKACNLMTFGYILDTVPQRNLGGNGENIVAMA